MRTPKCETNTWKHESLGGVADSSFQSVLLILLFATVFLLPTTMASEATKVTSANALFANKFYDILSKKEGNIFFSPISAHTVLAMAYQGAGGDTAKQFSATLNVPDQQVAAKGYNNIMSALNSIKNVTLHIANKIFVMQNFPLKEQFRNVVTAQFLSETESLNFAASGEAAANINGWVEKKTNSKIKDLISPDSLNDLTRLVLVNAVYFKGDWEHPFNKSATRTEPFHISSTKDVDCQMMHITKRFNYREDEELDAKILEMPYSKGNVSMVVILPNSIDGITDLEKKLVNVDLSTITQGMRHVEVEVSLPKFKIETEMDLKPILTEMGLGVIFAVDKADFSEISESSEPLYVSKAIQKAFIEVNEEGAEAAAATGAVAMLRCMPISMSEVEFIADHPFTIALLHKEEEPKNVLFLGRVNNFSA